MKEKIKTILFSILILIIIGGYAIEINAHPGNTASDGCHYCRTNCDSWGEAWNQRHCHGGSSYGSDSYDDYPSYDYPSYDYPSYDYPSYDYSYPSTPTCPSYSSYSSISQSCECYSGYVVSGGKCISEDQYCKNSFGYNAQYDILSDSCKCMYGYVVSGNSCVNGDSYCRNKYGYNSKYNSISRTCECDYGYVFNSSNQCVSEDDYCQGLHGYNAQYNILSDRCECKEGYEIENNKCVEIVPVIYSFYPRSVIAGESVTISGDNFGDYRGNVILNTSRHSSSGRISAYNIKSWSDDKIKFIVPEDTEADEYYIKIDSFSYSSEMAVSQKRLEVLSIEPEIESYYVPNYLSNSSVESQGPPIPIQQPQSIQPEPEEKSEPEPILASQPKPQPKPEPKPIPKDISNSIPESTNEDKKDKESTSISESTSTMPTLESSNNQKEAVKSENFLASIQNIVSDIFSKVVSRIKSWF